MDMDLHLFESLGLGLGLGLAAGFRVVVPFWVLSVAARLGHVPLAENMQWLDSYTALLALSIALVVELLAYSIPWLDNVMDAVAFPLAAIAGTLLMALAANQLDPLAQWSLAIVAGGGAAATVKGVHGLTRFLSTATSGGLTNFLVAIAELLGAVLFSVLSLVAPLLVLLAGLLGLAGLGWFIFRTFNRPPKPTSEAQ
ncbi:MAG TPA: DUF4126 domain-containing protein [Leptolyngbyaceae cyanobacterium M65_K2018_010]|nr:DUF4126 domain-containing protein [Leptolyngbyaceae cyanobacterium M65_K2018_010]